MYRSALSIYYTLAIFVVGTAFFVVQPTNSSEMSIWQNGIKNQFTTALEQTIGDQPWFSDFALVYDSVSSFYEYSSQATIALLTQPETDEDVIYVFSQVYYSFEKAFKTETSVTTAYKTEESPVIDHNFMTEDPLYNIVPYRSVIRTEGPGEVAGISVSGSNPVNSSDQPWVTIQDNLTGQLYCLAMYNGTVNNYLGTCKNDYH